MTPSSSSLTQDNKYQQICVSGRLTAYHNQLTHKSKQIIHSHIQCKACRHYRSQSKVRAVDKYKCKTVPNTWLHSLDNPKSNSIGYRNGAIKSSLTLSEWRE